MTEKPLFIIGEVVGVHGLGGNLKVRSYAESIETYKSGINVKLKSKDNSDEEWYEVLKASNHKKGILLSLKGIQDIELAQSLKGKEIFIKRDDLPELEENDYFWQDLIGLKVFDKKRGALGKIDSIIETGANDVFVVKQDKNGSKKEVLVPAIESVIIAVNIKEGTMKVELPEGL
ncbi:MAG: 16S rRNA processing protein RimM [Desulfobacteraceae bacterium]|nr:16S rRNA processing protein RimM [Desulfobacteraceae bacterium]